MERQNTAYDEITFSSYFVIFYLTGHIGLRSYVDFFADPYQQLIYLCLFIYAYPLINT